MKNPKLKKNSKVKALSLSLLLALGLGCSENEGIELLANGKSSNSVELSYDILNISAAQNSNPITNINDSSLSTRWSGEGTSVNLDVDFGTETLVDYLNIAFHNGDERISSFAYWQSNDGESWQQVGSKNSSGDTEEFEEFDLSNITARYLRLEFQGNTTNDWNSVLELEIYGTPDVEETSSTSIVIPAKIEAENFDAQTGIRMETTSDEGEGLNVGWINAEDYLSYNIYVPTTGTYAVDFRIASRNAGTNFDIYQGETKVGSIEDTTANGWQNWHTVSTDIDLTSGEQTIKLVATKDGWNINWFEINGAIKTIETPEEVTIPNGELDPSKTPAENFDLSEWKITLSSGDDVSVADLNDNFEYDNQFYTSEDGGMVFKNYPLGAGTTTNSTYSRVELREMLRGTNTDIDTKGINENNWVFDSSSNSNQSAAGGVGGVLSATLAVNKVTTTSSSDSQRGRIVIGQIHASDHEPIRLYYKKMPGETNGGIYFLHEDVNGNEVAVNLIGTLAEETGGGAGDYTGDAAPSNGIPLGEVFSYKIEVIGTILNVDIFRESGNVSASYDMSNSGFANDWMYFKAGLYSQNKSVQDEDDYEQVTFYALENTH